MATFCRRRKPLAVDADADVVENDDCDDVGDNAKTGNGGKEFHVVGDDTASSSSVLFIAD